MIRLFQVGNTLSKMRSLVVFVLLGVIGGVWGQTTNVNSCVYQSNAETLPLNAWVEGCINPTCQIPQLDYINIDIHFKSPRLIRNLVTEANAYILGPIGVSYDLGPQADTCNFLTNTTCPIKKDEVVRYQLQMFIESWMPVGTQVTVEFQVRDVSDRTVVMCLRLPIRIVAAVEGRSADANSTLQANATQHHADKPIIVVDNL